MSSKRLKIFSVLVGLLLIAEGISLFHRPAPTKSVPTEFASTKSAPTESASDSYTFPQTLQGLALSQSTAGPQAVSMINKLHGSNIKVKQGYIGQYDGSAGQIIVWVSESNNTDEARQLFDIMDRRIISAAQNAGSAGGAPPFTDRRTISHSGVSVIAVKGMGMENYYYQIDSKVYWVAVVGVNPVKTLDEFMKTTK